MRFTQQQHLRAAREFEDLRSTGTRRECGHFFLNFKAFPERKPSLRRVGVIASRRVGNAVCRNRAKRRLREVFRNNQSRLPESCDVILIARKSILGADMETLERRFKGAAGRILEETV